MLLLLEIFYRIDVYVRQKEFSVLTTKDYV